MPAHLTVIALNLQPPDVVLQSFPLPQRIHHQPSELLFFVAAEAPLQAEPFYLPEVVPQQHRLILLLIAVFEGDDSKLYWKVDAVNCVEPAVLEVVSLGLERDVPI